MAESDVILSKIILKVNVITIIQKIPDSSLYACYFMLIICFEMKEPDSTMKILGLKTHRGSQA